MPLLRKVDAVTFNVPDLDKGLRFYVDGLGHKLQWRNDEIGQAAVGLPDVDTEIVLTTQHRYEPNWLVGSAPDAAEAIERAGGVILSGVRHSCRAASRSSKTRSETCWCWSTYPRVDTSSTARATSRRYAGSNPAPGTQPSEQDFRVSVDMHSDKS